MQEQHLQHSSALLGTTHRETMDKASAVLAFISRSIETHVDASSNNGLESALSDYRSDELQGLLLICHVLRQALEYEPAPTTSYG